MEGVSVSFPLLIRGGLQLGQHPEPVPVNPKLVAGYRQTVRVNISPTSTVLEQIDDKAKACGMKRSELRTKVALQYEGFLVQEKFLTYACLTPCKRICIIFL